MAVATTTTLLPLDRFFRIAGINPLHANQIVIDGLAPAGTCGDPLLQYDWQESDKTGRETIAQTIADVEARLTDYLNFSPRPRYFKDKVVQYHKGHDWYHNFYGISAVDLGAGYVISGGREALSLIAAGAAITYTDSDSDGYFETATITVNTNVDALGNVVTVNRDIGVYYPSHAGDSAWEIRPVSTVVNSTAHTITCVFSREQAVKPELMFGLQSTGVDGLVNSNFLTTVDVYHHWLDPSGVQVQFNYESYCNINASAYSIQNGSMLIRDSKLGWASVNPSHWDAATQLYLRDCLQFCGAPDNLKVSFLAGYPLSAQGNMADIWERAITYLVLSEIDRPICACANLATFTSYWAEDMAQNTPQNTNQLSRRKLDNPIGTRRAELYAWDLIRRYRLPDKSESVAVGL
jgi:hypothetical protein